jgi:hypothetical protein
MLWAFPRRWRLVAFQELCQRSLALTIKQFDYEELFLFS